MSPSELKYRIENTGEDNYFFDRKTMKFFGDTMKNYGVRSAQVKTNYDINGNWSNDGLTVECWELYRKRAVKHGNKSSAYFAKADYRRVRLAIN